MTYLLGLGLLLVALAAVIAWAGDRLGTWAGRRRLSLFGARPRRTGQVVGMLAGVLIMLTTLGVLAVAFENATRTLANAQSTARELSRLQTQEGRLQAQVQALDEDLAATFEELSAARDTIRTAEEERDAALLARDAAAASRDSIRAEGVTLRAELASLASELEEVGAALGDAQEQLVSVQAELETARTERDTARQDAAQARAEVDELEARVAEVQEELEASNQQLEASRTELLIARVQVEEAQADVDETLAQLAEVREARDQVEAERDAAIADRDEAMAARDDAISERDTAIADRDEAIADRDEALAESEAARATIARLQRSIIDLQEESVRLEQQVATLRGENEALSLNNTDLVDANAELAQRNESLATLNAGLEDQIRQGAERAGVLQDQVNQLTRDLEDQARNLAAIQREYDRAARGDVTFETGELIYSGAIDAGGAAEAREALSRFVRDASAATSRRGAGDVVLSSAQVEGLVDAITQTDGGDLVRLISPRNQFSPVQVEVFIEAFENDQVLDAGRLLVSRRIHLGTDALPISQGELRASLSTLKGDALVELRRAGLDEFQLPRYPTLSEETFAGMLLRRRGQATIGIMVLHDVYRGGPADLELVVLD